MWFSEPHPFPKEDHLPDWTRRDNRVKKGDPLNTFQIWFVIVSFAGRLTFFPLRSTFPQSICIFYPYWNRRYGYDHVIVCNNLCTYSSSTCKEPNLRLPFFSSVNLKMLIMFFLVDGLFGHYFLEFQLYRRLILYHWPSFNIDMPIGVGRREEKRSIMGIRNFNLRRSQVQKEGKD
jgi:hypothetical protein